MNLFKTCLDLCLLVLTHYLIFKEIFTFKWVKKLEFQVWDKKQNQAVQMEEFLLKT